MNSDRSADIKAYERPTNNGHTEIINDMDVHYYYGNFEHQNFNEFSASNTIISANLEDLPSGVTLDPTEENRLYQPEFKPVGTEDFHSSEYDYDDSSIYAHSLSDFDQIKLLNNIAISRQVFTTFCLDLFASMKSGICYTV